jgi:Tfp pilus assembly protein PilV
MCIARRCGQAGTFVVVLAGLLALVRVHRLLKACALSAVVRLLASEETERALVRPSEQAEGQGRTRLVEVRLRHEDQRLDGYKHLPSVTRCRRTDRQASVIRKSRRTCSSVEPTGSHCSSALPCHVPSSDRHTFAVSMRSQWQSHQGTKRGQSVIPPCRCCRGSG